MSNAPIGSIVAWIGSDPSTPALPDGWVPCSGQVIDDTASPYNGTEAPDLNHSQRFLRGGSTSGIYQAATTINESVGFAHDIYVANEDGTAPPSEQSYFQNNNSASGSKPVYTMRPINMSVIWILRIK